MKKILAVTFACVSIAIQAEQDCYNRSTKHAARYAMRSDEDYHADAYKKKPVCQQANKSTIEWKSKNSRNQQDANSNSKKLFSK